jgi:hypothetical protein
MRERVQPDCSIPGALPRAIDPQGGIPLTPSFLHGTELQP